MPFSRFCLRKRVLGRVQLLLLGGFCFVVLVFSFRCVIVVGLLARVVEVGFASGKIF